MAVAIVGGAIANKPFNGGEAWVRLSWILGLRRLGFDTYFTEVLNAPACVDSDGRPAPYEQSINRAHLEAVLSDFGLEGAATLLSGRGERLHGLDQRQLADLIAEADVLFDISGHLGPLPIAAGAQRRVYVDLDPGFTQAWHADAGLPFRLSGYDRYVTVGLNVGRADCRIPTGGIDWIPTLPPVVLEQWPSAPMRDGPFRFTSVATWRSPFGAIEIGGRMLGLKHHQFRRFVELPERVADARFELALDIDPADAADRDALAAHGWSVVAARRVAASPDAFRSYVCESSGEFSVAQPAYAETASGWFSDRTAAYLATGRPVLVQDTGIGPPLADEGGLLTFSTPDEAVERARLLTADPASQGQAARAFAEHRLDSDLVLGRLLEALGVDG